MSHANSNQRAPLASLILSWPVGRDPDERMRDRVMRFVRACVYYIFRVFPLTGGGGDQDRNDQNVESDVRIAVPQEDDFGSYPTYDV